ncbi:YxlC family protein [Bacillus sp. FJAT-49705]|uniref:YxlC family protein n=1 Tax=Cytobacillus citreus TaxID=2833586 RepID=A0ABS5NLQ1_9BACI|nr:YxlC family protein [Cytobacillus citreus]MBS4188743.1 YxlC family protein [Cytobacillus citreus]
MTKQRDLRDNEQIDEGLFEVIKEIELGLESVEKSDLVYTPNIEWFENLVVEEKKNIRKKLIFDVTLFTLVAMLVLSTILFALYSIPVVFFTIQGLVTIFIAVYFTIQHVKQVKET